MNWISDILKKLDIKTTPLLISILVALFYIKSAGRVLLDVLIVFIISYLLCITIMHSFFYIKQRLNESTIKKRRNEKMRKKIEDTNNSIKDYFREMPDYKLNILIEVVKLPELTDSKYKRLIPAQNHLKMKLQQEDYTIPVNLRERLVVVRYIPNSNARSSMVVEFDSYAYSLIENYIKYGKL